MPRRPPTSPPGPAAPSGSDALAFVVPDAVGETERLDRVLRHRFPDWGRQTVGRIITAGEVEVNGRVVRLASWEVGPGDRVRVAHRPAPARTAGPDAFDDRWLVADDGDLVVVDKPAGLLCEPARDPDRA